MNESGLSFLNNSLLNVTRNIFEFANTTQSTNTTTTSASNENGENHIYLSRKNYFMLMIGGWILTAIFTFGVLFMVVTHFLGRYQWRKYQEELECKKDGVNHVIVDPKFMKYTQKGWKQIVYNM